MRKFEKTLVGRVLHKDLPESRVKAMMAFLPSVWKCEGRAEGIEMGRGSFHFRFEEEKDIQMVLKNRPYHFDGWMIAIDRWVPTVRNNFPSTIPFWVKIMDLPSQYREDDQVESIGEDLGDLQAWRIVAPYPMVRIEVGCDAPLILYRETETDSGEIFRITFDYVKLQNYCKRCLRMSHEYKHCPERLGRPRHFPEPSDRVVEEEERKRQRIHHDDTNRPKHSRDNFHKGKDVKPAEKVEPKPLRRDLMEELGEAAALEKVKNAPKAVTKEWVKKAFNSGGSKEKLKSSSEKGNGESLVTEKDGAGPSWLRPTVLEADIAKAIYAQEEKWEKAGEPARQPPAANFLKLPSCQIPAVREANRVEAEWRRCAQGRPIPADGSSVVEKLIPTVKVGPENQLRLTGPIDGLQNHEVPNGLTVGQGGKRVDQIINLEAYDIISPLRDILVEGHEGKLVRPRGGPRNLPKGGLNRELVKP